MLENTRKAISNRLNTRPGVRARLARGIFGPTLGEQVVEQTVIGITSGVANAVTNAGIQLAVGLAVDAGEAAIKSAKWAGNKLRTEVGRIYSKVRGEETEDQAEDKAVNE